MKKILIICFVFSMLFGASLPTRAQNTPTEPMKIGTWILNAGIGLSSYGYGEGLWLHGFGFKVAAEKGLWQAGPGVISLGGEAGMCVASHNGNNYSRFNIAPRSSYHYGWNVPGLDTYGGIAIGIGFASYSHHSGSDVGFYSGLYAGASYFFTDNFAVNAELGLGSTALQVGIAYRF
jgi:hypothetical protein